MENKFSFFTCSKSLMGIRAGAPFRATGALRPINYLLHTQNLLSEELKTKSEKLELTIYPNPSASGIFNISFKNQPADGELSIFNTIGIEVKRINKINELNLSVSLTEYAKGIYLFKYKDNNSGYQTKKVVYH